MGDGGPPISRGERHDLSQADGEGGRNSAIGAGSDAARGDLIRPGAAVRRLAGDVPPARLTMREIECLAWAAQGKSEWEMSRILGISEHTAEKHLINARVKLGAVNRAHAVATAIRRGLIL